METAELDPSELGTKEYWDECYAREKGNFLSSGDMGEVWFGEESMDRVMRYLEEEDVAKNSSVIDIGCGNGLFLVELACEGFRDLTGIDYSADAVNLATSIAKQKEVNIRFEVVNIVGDQKNCQSEKSAGGDVMSRQYDICHDKGTYDAICLSADSATERKRYREAVCRLLKPEGLFIITSCNWTADELLPQFVYHSSPLSHVCTLPTPQFQYGGLSGSLVSCLVLRRSS